MSNFYSGYPNQGPQQRQGASSSGAGAAGSFYGQGGYGQPPQQGGDGGGAGGASSSSYGGGYGAPQQQSWQQQQQAPAPAKPGQPPQPQQPIFNPALAAAAMSGVAAQGFTAESMMGAGEQITKHFLDAGTARLIPGLDFVMRTLRGYFAVDNRFVKRKMQRVLFPFMYKDWARMEDDSTTPGDNSIAYCPPVQDENAFDLYIPTMAFITYVLLCALCYGTAGKFNPEAPAKFLDLYSVTGYKYLGLSINMLVGLALSRLGWGHRGYYLTFMWTASAASYFMLKTMANNIPHKTAATGPKRELMVLGFACSQFATMWFVSQTRFLN